MSPTPILGACPVSRQHVSRAAAPQRLSEEQRPRQKETRFLEGKQAFLSSEAAGPNRPSPSQVQDPGRHRSKPLPGFWGNKSLGPGLPRGPPHGLELTSLSLFLSSACPLPTVQQPGEEQESQRT